MAWELRLDAVSQYFQKAGGSEKRGKRVVRRVGIHYGGYHPTDEQRGRLSGWASRVDASHDPRSTASGSGLAQGFVDDLLDTLRSRLDETPPDG